MKRIIALASIFLLCGCPKVAKAQVPVTLNPYGRQQFFDASGRPLSGGKICQFAAGTTTPLATYTDASGLFQNANPLILDAGGYGVLWLTANAYKFVLKTAGSDLTCNTGTQQWVLDNIIPAPFLSGNNSWVGNEVHSGTEVFNGQVLLNAGGSISGTVFGNPTFPGNPQITGTLTTTQPISATGGINTDTITGTNQSGGILTITGANALASFAGEEIRVNAGNAGPGNGTGGLVLINPGLGGFLGGDGGDYQTTTGSAGAGNGSAGSYVHTGGNGVGTGHGGNVSWTGGTGGGIAGTGGNLALLAGTGGAGGNGGNLSLAAGTQGAGGKFGYVQIGGHGSVQYNVNATTVAPTCASTGIGGAGTCALSNYSTDSDGRFLLTPAAGVGATGVVTLTFNQSIGANGGNCVWGLDNAGSGTWDTAATFFGGAVSSTTAVMTWVNNAAAPANLTAASHYGIEYRCSGRP